MKVCVLMRFALEDNDEERIVKIAVQINGKTKAIIEIDGELSKKEVFEK